MVDLIVSSNEKRGGRIRSNSAPSPVRSSGSWVPVTPTSAPPPALQCKCHPQGRSEPLLSAFASPGKGTHLHLCQRPPLYCSDPASWSHRPSWKSHQHLKLNLSKTKLPPPTAPTSLICSLHHRLAIQCQSLAVPFSPSSPRCPIAEAATPSPFSIPTALFPALGPRG